MVYTKEDKEKWLEMYEEIEASTYLPLTKAAQFISQKYKANYNSVYMHIYNSGKMVKPEPVVVEVVEKKKPLTMAKRVDKLERQQQELIKFLKEKLNYIDDPFIELF